MSKEIKANSINGAIGLYKISGMLVLQAVKEVDSEKLKERPQGSGNSMAWILGHLTSGRFVLAKHLGMDETNPFGDLYARGSEVKDSSAYPEFEKILDTFKEITQATDQRMREISEDELSASLDDTYPGQEKTVRGALTFLGFHESYHVGQMAYLRRLLGYDQLVG